MKTKNFNLDEFACNDGTPVPDEYLPNVVKLMAALEVIRYACGNRAIVVNSGYRSPKYNKKIGGAKKSQHLTASASDLVHASMSPDQLYEVIEILIDEGAIPEGGVGLYNSFVHYDVRGTKARWKG